MKKLLLDTNILIDLLAKREDFYKEAASLFSMADKNEVELYVSSLTIENTNYILLRGRKPEEARAILRKLRIIVKILSLDDKVVGLALNDDNFKDFEDGLQYYTAIENGLDIIITRNKKDFNSAKIPVMSAKEFLKSI